ncbi:hypothetical protein chiPu_0009814 [Chiloscyllium punctatum]|uniref:Uncharacterized protein n=1 Tax=Chiloscyllium punctatum TaxID=137246 RepID=A0A401SLT5_CHIPU|nr:hypothetical protein [Chiloscyllium punctatum]
MLRKKVDSLLIVASQMRREAGAADAQLGVVSERAERGIRQFPLPFVWGPEAELLRTWHSAISADDLGFLHEHPEGDVHSVRHAVETDDEKHIKQKNLSNRLL